ncbi:MAG: MerR family transcriptional regulator [Candidatus Pacebacteria bacterium]|nr:MerR family transcriptional regulator [Candidatus Paceibacterota bacterium]
MPKQTQKEYQKRLEKLNWLIEREFIPSELKKITGLSRRQIAEWDKKGILLSKQRKSSDTWSWRKFTGANIIQLAILAEVRKTGLSPTEFKKLAIWLKKEEEKLLTKLKEEIGRGHTIFLNTNLKDKFTLVSKEDKTGGVLGLLLGYGKYDEDNVILQLNINNIINGILKGLTK